MHTLPLDRLSRPPALPHDFKVGDIRKELRVAIHTGLRRWQSSRSSLLNRLVAITAVDAIITNVMLVRKLNWLLTGDKGLGNVCSPIKIQNEPEGPTCDKTNQHDAKPRKRIRAAGKDLWHILTSNIKSCGFFGHGLDSFLPVRSISAKLVNFRI